ncbi:hypothetical protein PVAP13_8KG307200 [Panicum virgatum]|uniref:Reverse transcriptase zinc-binding domain-containing protein n=1 Tax=Panicum virgatum TaxID=38727 RepID=A0A8T0PPJ6_PANVG|nr:hypothetical protein PVAP13_8KG307200 [Panicum virgatum]
MLHRNICKQEESSCECCPGTLETSEHIFVSCPCARAVWGLLGIAVGDGMHQQPWLLGCELQLPHSVQADVMLLVLWQIWKARNALIFDRATSLPTDVLRRTIKDMDFWSSRYKKLCLDFDRWRSFLLSCC